MQGATLPRLRSYRASDAPFVERLARQAFGEYSPRAGAPSVRAATMPGVVAIVAVLGDEPVGFAMTTFAHGESPSGDFAASHGTSADCSLDAIAVESAQRGKGVGKLLLAGVFGQARKRGALAVRLVTAEANVAALDLFIRYGFEIVERRAQYYPRGQNAVVMRAKLVP